MRKIILLLLTIPCFAIAQPGIHFEHGLTWKQILAKAKAEKKYIFMDAFTTWCGPCRYMSANIFPKAEVGKFFNANYISVKMQLDTTKNDNEEVRKSYPDAHQIMNYYAVNVFPTYLFFDPNGQILHRAVGSSEANKFIAKAKDAMNPDKQYYVLLRQYTSGRKDPDFLRSVAYACKEAYDNAKANYIAKEYLNTQKDLWTNVNVEFIDNFTQSTNDVGFVLMLNNPSKFDALRGAGTAKRKIVSILLEEKAYPVILKKNASAPNWSSFEAYFTKNYPLYAKEVIADSKVAYYQMKKDWDNFQPAVIDYMKNFGANVTPAGLNNFAWTVFENCKDMTCVTEALSWSRRSFEGNNDPMFIDTYANILYKLGRNTEAIEWETKALALVGEEGKKTYAETLDKMKKGEKTWKE